MILQKISSKSVQNFLSNPVDRQTEKPKNKQRDRLEYVSPFFGAG